MGTIKLLSIVARKDFRVARSQSIGIRVKRRRGRRKMKRRKMKRRKEEEEEEDEEVKLKYLSWFEGLIAVGSLTR